MNSLVKTIPLVFLVLSACSLLPVENKIGYQVSLGDLPIIRFEGKGAAVGMMMSSSMGSMGIAIGVAIDEGIAKDIRSALDHADCNLEEVVGSSFQAVSRGHSVMATPVPDHSRGADIWIHVDGVTFKVQPSERDLTLAEVSLRMEKSGVSHDLASEYPFDDVGKLIPLEEIRVDGSKACELLRESVSRVFDVWYQR